MGYQISNNESSVSFVQSKRRTWPVLLFLMSIIAGGTSLLLTVGPYLLLPLALFAPDKVSGESVGGILAFWFFIVTPSVLSIILLIVFLIILKKSKSISVRNESVNLWSVALGIMYSLLIFIIAYGSLLILLFVSSYGGSGSSVAFVPQFIRLNLPILIPSMLSLLATGPFLFVNSTIYVLLKKPGERIGIMVGYLLVIIIFTTSFSFHLNGVNVLNEYDRETQEAKSFSIEEIVSNCSKEKEEYLEISCLQEIAIKSNNLLVCDKIKEKSVANANSCYTNIARALDNISVCEKVSDREYDKDMCIFDVGTINKRDPAICDKLSSDYYKNFCKNYFLNY